MNVNIRKSNGVSSCVFNLFKTKPHAIFATLLSLAPLTLTAQGQLSPLPGQSTPQPNASQTPSVASGLQPLPGLAPIPSPQDPADGMSAALIAERDQLRRQFDALKLRHEQVTASDVPVSAATREQLEITQAKLIALQQADLLEEWKVASANTLLQTMNGRPLGAVEMLPVNTVIEPKFVQMRLSNKAYNKPSSETGAVLYAVTQNAPLLELATTQDKTWSFVWVPNGGYGYVLNSLISNLGVSQ